MLYIYENAKKKKIIFDIYAYVSNNLLCTTIMQIMTKNNNRRKE